LADFFIVSGLQYALTKSAVYTKPAAFVAGMTKRREVFAMH
jgi:hypothetical protein